MTHLHSFSLISTGERGDLSLTFLHLRRFQLQQVLCALEVSVILFFFFFFFLNLLLRHKENVYFIIIYYEGRCWKAWDCYFILYFLSYYDIIGHFLHLMLVFIVYIVDTASDRCTDLIQYFW